LVVAVTSIALLLLVAFNFVATVRVLRSDLYSAKQKWAQVLLVWLVPLLGAILVWSVLSPPRDLESNRSSDMSPVRDDLWWAARPEVDPSPHTSSDGSGHGNS
jgi:hypothetical protein